MDTMVIGWNDATRNTPCSGHMLVISAITCEYDSDSTITCDGPDTAADKSELPGADVRCRYRSSEDVCREIYSNSNGYDIIISILPTSIPTLLKNTLCITR